MSESSRFFVSTRLPSFEAHSTLASPLPGLFRSFTSLAAGIAVGLSGLAAGLAIGIVGDVGARANAQQPKIFVGMVLILIVSTTSAI